MSPSVSTISIDGLCAEVDLLEARLLELETRFESLPLLLELLARHEDQLRMQEAGEDFVK